MANLRALVRRRKAIRNIRKITKTMELIATARFKKALDRATEAEAYTQKIAELAADLSKNAGEVSHPLLETRATVKKILFLVITANRGLCGGYNGGILRTAMARVRELNAASMPFTLEVAGKRGINYFKFQGVPRTNEYTHFEDKPKFEEVDAVASRYIDLFVSGQIDQVVVCYQKFQSISKQYPVIETLLPLSSVSVETGKKGPTPATPAAAPPAGAGVDYEFLPDASGILGELVPVAFKVRLFKCFLDAAVSEQIARRVAMKAATENAGDLIKDVTRVYNRTRQANITKEISELIAGSEALK
ncbi:ATP synthase F1 subunit gamma [Fimbriiglobus ruber]|uniref:ATP synthase gamma chain n=1 Tax=Fimbriiglobus ruber TaxID=1908690 RepID=A0A225EFN1_9BACT|nr:ATP synthase F1 subunit gamma [Fimbriiglobus ruber]OWK47155.1 ATP synthase gamma chain [Fimbriiglobus ruber]